MNLHGVNLIYRIRLFAIKFLPGGSHFFSALKINPTNKVGQGKLSRLMNLNLEKENMMLVE